MSHRRAKALRAEMVATGLDPTETQYQAKAAGIYGSDQIRLAPSCGRKIYRRAKKLLTSG